jgi:putative ABC transport system permease protein
MNALTLALASIRSRPLQSGLCAAATAAGIALLCAVFLLTQGIADGFLRNARGIDVVVGAKGSPLQLVLSTVYHADVPTGNIEGADAEKIMHHAQVKQAIPLALGDNYKGWRIVGTTTDYLSFFDADIQNGRLWNANFEAVAGSATELSVGTTFAGAHGLDMGGETHDDQRYTVVGTLKPTGTVLDRLILTSVRSVQDLHHDEHHGDSAHDEHEAHEEDHMGDMTALLLRVKSPLAVMNLPREINRSTNIMAAAPSYEMARLSKNFGIGRDVFAAVGIGFVALSALMLLSMLASSLATRRYDLAVLRVLGAAPERLFATVMIEALILSGIGSMTGILMGHGIAYFSALEIDSLKGLISPSSFIGAHEIDALLLAVGLGTGWFAALVPAFSAAKTDIAGLLARGRA